jgi:Domain of unknown function (DUF222)
MFEELGQAIDGLDIPVDADAVAAVIALRDRLEARISAAVAAVDEASLWELDGATSMTAWLADRAGMARPQAAATASRARKLTNLSVTPRSWRAGVLSSGQVEAIAANLDADTARLFADHEASIVPTLKRNLCLRHGSLGQARHGRRHGAVRRPRSIGATPPPGHLPTARERVGAHRDDPGRAGALTRSAYEMRCTCAPRRHAGSSGGFRDGPGPATHRGRSHR